MLVPPSPSSVAAPPSPRLTTPRGLEQDASSTAQQPSFRMRSAGGVTLAQTQASPAAETPAETRHESHGGGKNIQEIVAGAEQQMEEQLRSMRSVLVQSLSALTHESKASEGALRNENRRLQQALAQARAREAEYEDKLKQASQLITGLAA